MEIRRLTDSFSVSPQIALEDLAMLKARGFSLVINNRPDGEEAGQPTSDEMETAAEAAGISYTVIPVAGGFSNFQIAAMADRLREADGPVLAFCRSGTRSTLLWALAEATRGQNPQEIAASAAGAGYDIAPVRAEVERLAGLTS